LIDSLINEIYQISYEYGFDIFFIDRTENTALIRFGFTPQIFFQVYINIMKGKLNLALVVGDERIYGFDGEGGKYHEHPSDSPQSHLFTSEKKGLQEFIRDSLEILKKKGLI